MSKNYEKPMVKGRYGGLFRPARAMESQDQRPQTNKPNQNRLLDSPLTAREKKPADWVSWVLVEVRFRQEKALLGEGLVPRSSSEGRFQGNSPTAALLCIGNLGPREVREVKSGRDSDFPGLYLSFKLTFRS